MNKKAIQYDNSLKYSSNDPRKPPTQSKMSLKRSHQMIEKYHKKPKSQSQDMRQNISPQANLGDRPQWNDRIPPQKNVYQDKLEGRLVRSDYGKEVPVVQNTQVDLQKQTIAMETKNSLQQLQEIVQNEKIIKTNEISKKSGQQLKQLQEQMAKEDKIIKMQEKSLSSKYEKISEQKQLNQFLEEQIGVIRSHKKDLVKATELENVVGTGSRDKREVRKEKPSLEADKWNEQLSDMRRKTEESHQKALVKSEYLKKEEAEEQIRNNLISNEEDGFQRQQRFSGGMTFNDQRSVDKNLDQYPRKEGVVQAAEVAGDIGRDKFLEISRQDAWRQYDISKSLKETKLERLSEKQHYLAVERALGSLESGMQEEQKKKDSVFSGNLIGRATSKLIRVHSDAIADLLVDDLLYEIVAILSSEDANQKEECDKMTRECLVNDYLDEFRELAYEQCDIVDRIKQGEPIKRDAMNFRQTTPQEHNAFYINEGELKVEKFEIELSLGVLVNILQKKSEFLRMIQKYDHYQKKNMQTFSIITEHLLDDLLTTVTKDFDQANDQYAELMFEHEFK